MKQTNEQVIEKFMVFMMKDKSCRPNTYKAYLSDISDVAKFFYDVALIDLSENQLRLYIHSLIEMKKAPRTINRKISSISAFYNFVISQGIIQVNPAKNLSKVKVPKTIPITMSENQAEAFLNGILLVGKYALRDYTMFLTFIFTAMRVSEIARISIHDLDLSKNIIHIRDGKGGKDRMIPIVPRLAETLRMYLTTDAVLHKDTNKINKYKSGRSYFVKEKQVTNVFLTQNGDEFTEKGIDYLFKKYTKKLGIYKKGLTLHSLRRSCLTFLLNENVDVFTLKEISGHSRVQTLEHYLSINYNRVSNAISKHPLANQGFDWNYIEILRNVS